MSTHYKRECVAYEVEPDSEPSLVRDHKEQASILQIGIVPVCFDEPFHLSVASDGRKPGQRLREVSIQ